jgi:hypothetical protein
MGEPPFAPTPLSTRKLCRANRRSPLRPSPTRKLCGANRRSPLHPLFCGRGAEGEGKTQNGSTETDLATSASAIPNMPISPIPQKKPASSTGA